MSEVKDQLPALANGQPDEEVATARPSRLDAIARKREEVARDKTLTLLVPGYDGMVAVRYKAIPGEQITQLSEQLERSRDEKRLLHVAADVVVRTCDEILIREKPEQELEPIDQDAAAPTTFSSKTLPGLVGFEAETAREEVFGLFSPGGSHPLAVVDHANGVINWLQGKSQEIDQGLLGE